MIHHIQFSTFFLFINHIPVNAAALVKASAWGTVLSVKLFNTTNKIIQQTIKKIMDWIHSFLLLFVMCKINNETQVKWNTRFVNLRPYLNFTSINLNWIGSKHLIRIFAEKCSEKWRFLAIKLIFTDNFIVHMLKQKLVWKVLCLLKLLWWRI